MAGQNTTEDDPVRKAPPQTLRKPIRKAMRRRGEPMSQDVRLQHRNDGLVRLSLMKAAREQYGDDIPETVTQWYDPVQNVVVIDLPDPEPAKDEDGQIGLNEL